MGNESNNENFDRLFDALDPIMRDVYKGDAELQLKIVRSLRAHYDRCRSHRSALVSSQQAIELNMQQDQLQQDIVTHLLDDDMESISDDLDLVSVIRTVLDIEIIGRQINELVEEVKDEGLIPTEQRS